MNTFAAGWIKHLSTPTNFETPNLHFGQVRDHEGRLNLDVSDCESNIFSVIIAKDLASLTFNNSSLQYLSDHGLHSSLMGVSLAGTSKISEKWTTCTECSCGFGLFGFGVALGVAVEGGLRQHGAVP